MESLEQTIATTLLAWYKQYGRVLPWRAGRNPYHIWLSEVILQQTRVQQGWAYYERFIERFPTVEQLAAASEDEVLKLWQGLGYYSRARNLHAAARQIVTEFDGHFPHQYETIRRLRGVGDYTAAAIASIGFDLPYAVVDGNVYRLLARVFDLATPIDTTEGRKNFAALAQSLLDPKHAADYNQAVMDFGALQCTPQKPSCIDCPLADRCLALAAGTVGERPVKQGRTKSRNRYFNYLHLTDGRHTLLHRRAAGDIWQGLYEFPLIETEQPLDAAALAGEEAFRRLIGATPFRLSASKVMPPHQLSHQRIYATFHRIEVEALHATEAWIVVEEADLGEYAVSRLTDRYLQTAAR